MEVSVSTQEPGTIKAESKAEGSGGQRDSKHEKDLTCHGWFDDEGGKKVSQMTTTRGTETSFLHSQRTEFCQ